MLTNSHGIIIQSHTRYIKAQFTKKWIMGMEHFLNIWQWSGNSMQHIFTLAVKDAYYCHGMCIQCARLRVSCYWSGERMGCYWCQIPEVNLWLQKSFCLPRIFVTVANIYIYATMPFLKFSSLNNWILYARLNKTAVWNVYLGYIIFSYAIW